MFTFKFKRKVKQLGQSIKRAVEPARDTQEIIAEIHESFDTASEKLLNEAKAILAGSYDIEKGIRLKKVGFVSAKKAVEASDVLWEKEKSEILAKLIQYYQHHYPNNKFITEEKTKEICKKYGLLCADIKYYISDVPEKNLSEIENFKLREEDMIKHECGYRKNGYWVAGPEEKSVYGYLAHSFEGGSYPCFVRTPEDQKVVYQSYPMKICAAVKDFNTKNMKIADGYKLELNLPDPIVLQPIKGGYLVVSKWGLEANDADLINEKMN